MTDILTALETGDMQPLIDAGHWGLEGSTGRAMMAALESGECHLPGEPHRDYWGNRIPAFYEIEPGSTGSLERWQEYHDTTEIPQSLVDHPELEEYLAR